MIPGQLKAIYDVGKEAVKYTKKNAAKKQAAKKKTAKKRAAKKVAAKKKVRRPTRDEQMDRIRKEGELDQVKRRPKN